MPQVEQIEKDYKRAIARHRSLAIAGDVIGTIPILGVLLSQSLFNQILVDDIVKMVPGTIASLASALAINKIHERHLINSLEDEAYYLIWRINRPQ